MMHQVVRAVGRPDYSVELGFEGGENAVVDLSEFVSEGIVTAPLRADPQLFCSGLRIVDGGDAIGWPGDLEIDADALWYKAHPEDWERDYGRPAAQQVQRTT